MSGNLLIHEPPLQVLPRLAKAIGLKEAVVLQQLHYLTQRMKPEGGWIYNTIPEWCAEQFPFLPPRTMRRVWDSLESKGLVKTKQSRSKDRTKFYRVDYTALKRLAKSIGQSDLLEGPNWPLGAAKVDASLEQQENVQRNNTSAKADRAVKEQVDRLFAYWTQTLEKRAPKLSAKRERLVQQRLGEGFSAKEIAEAIKGVTYSPHHMGQNDRGPKGEGKPFNDLALICRDAEHVEDFRDLYRQANGAKAGGTESIAAATNAERKRIEAEQEGAKP